MSYAALEGQTGSQRSISRLFEDLNMHSKRALEMHHMCESLNVKAHTLAELHPEYVSPDHRIIAANWIVLAALPVVCFLDFLLISNAAEYLATLLFPEQPIMVLIARLFVPIGFLFVELLFAVKLFGARERAADGAARTAEVGWLLAGFAWAAAISVIVLASQVAAASAEGSPLLGPALLLVCGITTIAFLLHLLVLLGGRQLREANGYLCFSIKRQWYEFRGRKALHKEKGARCKAENTFGRIVSAVGNYNMRYPGEPFVLPLAKSARIVISEAFGDQALPPEHVSMQQILSFRFEGKGESGNVRPIK
jgi:hypothetical protein